MILIFYMTTPVTPACRGEDPTLFVGPECEDRSDREFREQEAKDVCARCPLISDCREWAIVHHEVGVWGGTNDDDRRAIRTGRRSADPGNANDQTRRRIERQARAWILQEEGMAVEEIAKIVGVKPATVYDYLRSQRMINSGETDQGPEARTEARTEAARPSDSVR